MLVLGSDNMDLDKLSWLVDRTLIIGRASADIELQIGALSRQHAQVSVVNAACQIRDLNSRNGTAVNGRLLSHEPCILINGDSILLAGRVELHFHDPNATPFVPPLGAVRGLWIDPNNDDVWIDAQRLTPALSHKQTILLKMIVDADGEIIARDSIAAKIWPNASPNYVNSDAINSLIKRLRLRLRGLEGGRPVLDIIRGRGIRLNKQRD